MKIEIQNSGVIRIDIAWYHRTQRVRWIRKLPGSPWSTHFASLRDPIKGCLAHLSQPYEGTAVWGTCFGLGLAFHQAPFRTVHLLSVRDYS